VIAIDFDSTYGSGCTQKGDTRVEIEGLTADISPYDRTATGRPCTMELRFFQHAAELRFDRAGIARVRVRGRSVPSNEIITVERTVHVQ
jgi:hypothetical protein